VTEAGEMWAQASLCQLPDRLRTPWLFPQDRAPASPADDSPESSVRVIDPASFCGCGCGQRLMRAVTGRPMLYVDHNHRQAAYRARKARQALRAS
jgi:hypothetical protein